MTTSIERRIFLSASIPLPSRNAIYFNTADVIAIRDAIRALTIVIVETGIQLIFGGHPAISPMIRLQIAQAGIPVGDKVVMYQSRFFKREFPEDNKMFERVILTDTVNDNRELSLAHMRNIMMQGPFLGGIFIGGMEGVEEEYKIFCNTNPEVPVFPVASTGAAARNIYYSNPKFQNNYPELQSEISYINLIRRIVGLTSP
ncbi:SLOG domain-containing protein [Novacetimonas hansenii]|uniref:SLOG domain-containing protein n=1 Tax=Novacetimonas hansenii TaxID=436 RepID=UPI000792004C|nr:hypothetical protein [Novacetimonas hansenii]RFP03141.1 hypothetical protein BGC30_03455 [Novacetimonas hansenii]WEQ57780.1 hypothetical protein LV563_07565 [Novacetimonas hansenii]CUW46306.1 hypothetical protein ATCC53582_00398 [Novacetimonas hansenii]